MDEENKRAIVIGASSGLGREIARLLYKRGYCMGIAARRVERLEALREELGDGVEIASIDVTKGESVEAFERLAGRLGGVDLLVYCAGVGWQNPSLDEDKEMATVATNALGFTRMIGSAYRYMSRQGRGHIAVITSIAGTKGLGPAPAYSATKAMQNVYLQALEQLANTRGLNIRFTDIRPGFVATDLLGEDKSYPMLMEVSQVAKKIVKAIESKKHVRVVDYRWRLVTACWRRVPRWLWRRLRLVKG